MDGPDYKHLRLDRISRTVHHTWELLSWVCTSAKMHRLKMGRMLLKRRWWCRLWVSFEKSIHSVRFYRYPWEIVSSGLENSACGIYSRNHSITRIVRSHLCGISFTSLNRDPASWNCKFSILILMFWHSCKCSATDFTFFRKARNSMLWHLRRLISVLTASTNAQLQRCEIQSYQVGDRRFHWSR